jgi:hypothetical protein
MADQQQIQSHRDALKKILKDAAIRIGKVEKSVDAMGPYELAEAEGVGQVLEHIFEEGAPGGAMLFDANGIC